MFRDGIAKSRLAFGMVAFIALVVVGCSSEVEEVVAPKKEAVQQKLPEVKKFEPLHSLLQKSKSPAEFIELMKKSGRNVQEALNPAKLKNSPTIQYVASSGGMSKYWSGDYPHPDNWNGVAQFTQNSASYTLFGSPAGSNSLIQFTANNYSSGLYGLSAANSYMMVADVYTSSDFSTGNVTGTHTSVQFSSASTTSIFIFLPPSFGNRQLYVYLTIVPLNGGTPIDAPSPWFGYFGANAAYQFSVQE